MKFDHTFIAIRQRTTLETYDLALHVLRDYLAPLALLLLIGAAPWILLDSLLVGWMLNSELCDSYTVSLFGWFANGTSSSSYAVSYSWCMIILICSQAQVGTAMMVHYLGQSMFIGKPSVRDSVQALWRVPLTYYWLHFGLRLILPIALLVLLMNLNHADPDAASMINSLLAFALLASFLTRSLRPFVTKIVVLEKAPWKATDSNPISFSKRTASLHGSGNGLFSNFLLSGLFAIPLCMGIYGGLVLVYSWVGFSWTEGFVELAIIWPMSMWITAGFFAIVRFLTYIDLRIRQEGWEVELRIRAEALKLREGIA